MDVSIKIEKNSVHYLKPFGILICLIPLKVFENLKDLVVRPVVVSLLPILILNGDSNNVLISFVK